MYKVCSLLQWTTKFTHRYNGPFKVLRKVGEFTYQLLFPNITRIHYVFHVLQLKRYMCPDVQVVGEPESIIGKRKRVLQTRSLVEFWVKWKGLPPEEASWWQRGNPLLCWKGLVGLWMLLVMALEIKSGGNWD